MSVKTHMTAVVLIPPDGVWGPIRFGVNSVSLIRRGDPPDDVFRLDRTIRLGRPG